MDDRNHKLAGEIAKKVKEEGGTAYFVGGYVRDQLRGVNTKDIDMEVHGISPDSLRKILQNMGSPMEIGASFGISGIKGYDIDIAMPRKEEKRGVGHRDFDVLVNPFIGTREAARRRDFTINAMMENVLTGEIIDPFGGLEDLEKGILRHVDDTTFGDDPLRVLRAAQFASRFSYQVADETMQICKEMDVSHLSRERVVTEMEKALLQSDKPSIFFQVLREMDQLGIWFPELEALIGIPQSPVHHAEGDVWIHTMMVLDVAVEFRAIAKNPFGYMLAALTHDFGKAITTEEIDGVIHAYEHETKGLPLIRTFLQRLTNEKDLIRYVLNLSENHMKPLMVAAHKSALKSTNKMFDTSVDPKALIALSRADGKGKIPPLDKEEWNDFLEERYEQFNEIMEKPHVTGDDLIQAGLVPNENFKEYLALAHKLRLAGVDKESALKQTLAQVKIEDKRK